jgi:VanZ family protein
MQKSMDSDALLENAAIVIGWLGVVAIAAASLAPGHLRPHIGLPGQMEHALAYGLTGALLSVGYVRPYDRLGLWFGLAACSALFEILQHFVPGRSPNFLDSLASIAGLTAGLLAGAALQMLFAFKRG